jgi:hypothetical protein
MFHANDVNGAGCGHCEIFVCQVNSKGHCDAWGART